MEMTMSRCERGPKRSREQIALDKAAAAERTAERKRIAARKREWREAQAAAKAQARAQAERAIVSEVCEARARGDAAVEPIPAAPKRKAAKVGNRIVLGTREVPNPLAVEPGERMVVAVNLAEHPLEMMLARRRLIQAHYEAGVRYRRIWERAVIGPGRGIDPGKIKVDGGKLVDPLSDEVVHAQLELAALARTLGQVGERIVSQVAGSGLTLGDLAERWPGPEGTRAKLDYLTIRLREALDLLATEVWGAKGPERGTITGERGMGSGDVDMQAVDAANQFHLRKRGITI